MKVREVLAAAVGFPLLFGTITFGPFVTEIGKNSANEKNLN